MSSIHLQERRSGISLIEKLPWGSHFCQFYQNDKDLLDILVPYFKAGLEDNEMCLWVLSGPLDVATARKGLEAGVPGLDEYLNREQLEIIPESQWHQRGGASDTAVPSELDKAMSKGFDGLRLSCGAMRSKKNGAIFTCYGTDVVSSHNVIAAFTYPRDEFDAVGLMDVVKNHRFALVRNLDTWEIIEASEVWTVVKNTLKRTEEKLESIFSNMLEGFAYHRVILDGTGNPCDYVFLEVNEAFEKITGLPGKKIIGRRVTEVIPGIENDPADWIGRYGRVAMTGKPAHFESYAEALQKWFSVSAFSPHKAYFAATFSDVTEHKRMEDALRASEERYRTTIASIGDAVITTDDTGRIAFMNPVAEQLTGWLLSEAGGRPVSEVFRIVNEQTRKHVACPVARVLREGTIVGLANHTILIRKDGTEIAIDDSGAPIKGKDGIIGVVLVFRDISERGRLYRAAEWRAEELERRVQERTAELQQAYDKLMRETREREQVEAQLRQAQKMDALGTLTGGIAHDFNNILAAIIGFTEIAKDRIPVESPVQRQLSRVLNAGIRGRELVKHMLTFSRQGEQEKKPLPLASIVKETIKLLRASIPTTISIRLNITSESSFVFADPVQIQQVLMNLCANGAYAMRERGGALGVDLSDCTVTRSDGNPRNIAPGLYAKLAVRDTGSGIPPEIIEKLFDPFFTTKRPGEGTGLGLSVVHGIVKQHSGYITVESEPGRGSVFSVYLPKVTEEGPAEAVGETSIPAGRERVLFVDDEEALAEIGQELLEEMGYAVTVKGSSVDALAAFRSNPRAYDVIITDQTMPEMTGLELAREVLTLRPDIPVILCTGFSHLIDSAGAAEAGIRSFLMKPLTKSELARALRDVLDTP